MLAKPVPRRYQFLIGTIYTVNTTEISPFRLYVSIPYRDDLYLARSRDVNVPVPYQFLIGTIYTIVLAFGALAGFMYQFLIGTIYTRKLVYDINKFAETNLRHMAKI